MENVSLAIDAESGDFGPEVIISGLLDAWKGSDIPFKALLCGNQDKINSILARSDTDHVRHNLEIIHCVDSISPQDKRASAWKKRANSSIIRCISLQKNGLADASVSAGDTAILMGASLFILGRSEGVSRPALAAFLPTVKKEPVLLLDIGANLNCRADHLVSFARMGYQYMGRLFDRPSIVIALLNIGKEPNRGTRAVKDADTLLKKEMEQYIGFIEGNDILSGKADVVICDGFTGNVLLKVCESFHILVESVLGRSRGWMKSKMAILDPENYGAVPFLGIRGTVLKAHGGSSSRAIANAILAAITAVRKEAVWSRTVRPKGI